MSTYRLKSTVRKPKKPIVTQGKLLKRKRLLALDTRRRNLARATQHLLFLEQAAPKGSRQAIEFQRSREETVALAERLPR